jgi:hypothetical protein
MMEWEAYFEIEPWGEMMADRRNSVLCQLLANIHRSEKQAPFKAEDFLLVREPEQPQSVAQQRAVLRALAGK